MLMSTLRKSASTVGTRQGRRRNMFEYEYKCYARQGGSPQRLVHECSSAMEVVSAKEFRVVDLFIASA